MLPMHLPLKDGNAQFFTWPTSGWEAQGGLGLFSSTHFQRGIALFCRNEMKCLRRQPRSECITKVEIMIRKAE
jgi:hypothetical protein